VFPSDFREPQDNIADVNCRHEQRQVNWEFGVVGPQVDLVVLAAIVPNFDAEANQCCNEQRGTEKHVAGELSITEDDLHLLHGSVICLRVLLKDVRHLLVNFCPDLANRPIKGRH